MSSKVITWGEVIKHKYQNKEETSNKEAENRVDDSTEKKAEKKADKKTDKKADTKVDKKADSKVDNKVRDKIETKLIPNSPEDENIEDRDDMENDLWQGDDLVIGQSSDPHGAGIGHSIVCQVVPSQNPRY